MKKLFTFLLLGMALFSTSCEKEPLLEYELPNLGKSLEVEAEGGSIDIDITADCNYEILCKDSWVSIEETESGIRVKVDANIKTESRETEIRLLYNYKKEQLYKSIKVVQKAFEPTLSIDKTELNFDVNGGSKTVYITTNASAFRVAESSDWISCTQSGNRVEITVTASNVTTERTAEVKIHLSNYNNISQIIKITQKEFVPVLDVNATELIFDVIGSSQTIYVTANCEWEIWTSTNWITCTQSDFSVTIVLSINTSIDKRTTDIIIKNKQYSISKAVTITQNGANKDHVILYSSSNSKVVTPYRTSVFGANIVSNTYENGKGVILFDGPVTSIGDAAFYGCTSLTSVTIPDSVTSIGGMAFQGCTSLTSVTIPDSVTSIGDQTFYGCSGLTAFYGKFASADNRCLIVDGVLKSFVPAGLAEYTIPDSVTSIGNVAFFGCSNLTSVTIPDSVTSIGRSAFYNCSSLTSVTIPDSVTSIGIAAFSYCGEAAIEIPNSVTTIKSQAFTGCSGKLLIDSKIVEQDYTEKNCPTNKESSYNGNWGWLANANFSEVVIGNSIEKIGDYAFYGCDSIKDITISDSVKTIGQSAFDGEKKIYGAKLIMGDGVTTIKSRAFASKQIETINVTDNIKAIAADAFSSSTSRSVYVYINNWADYCERNPMYNIPGKKWLRADGYGGYGSHMKFPDGITRIGGGAFKDCYNSFDFSTLPNSVTSIGESAFAGSLVGGDIIIPDSVTEIGWYAFFGCTSIDRVYCKPTTPPTLGYYAFSYIKYNTTDYKVPICTIYVPYSSISEYKTAGYGWIDYKSYIQGF